MIASKVICDDTYSNKSWCVVGQGMFSLREINQMEREMCSYLKWVLNVKPEELSEFEAEVKRDYGVGGAKAPAPISTSPVRSATITPIPFVAPARVAPIVVRAAAMTAPAYSPDSTDSSPPSPSHSDGSSPTSSKPRTPTLDIPAGPTPSCIAASVCKTSAVPMSKQPSVAQPVHVKVAEGRIPEQDGGKR